jgi:serine/threonine protein kinase
MFHEEYTTATQVNGTARWMPPEYMLGQTQAMATFAGDIYSFAMICYVRLQFLHHFHTDA